MNLTLQLLYPEEHSFYGYLVRSWAILDVVYHTATLDKVRHCHYKYLPLTTSPYLSLLAITCYYWATCVIRLASWFKASSPRLVYLKNICDLPMLTTSWEWCTLTGIISVSWCIETHNYHCIPTTRLYL
jgi:hypothetical protein